MPRQAQIRYWDSRGGYYCQVKRKQHRLAAGPDDYPSGPTYLEAVKAFAALMEAVQAPRTGQRNRVRTICNLFLDRHKNRVAAATFKAWCRLLRPFTLAEGERPCAHLSHPIVDAFLERQRIPRFASTPKGAAYRCSWGDASVSQFCALLARITRWAEKVSLIDYDPLKGYELPPPPRTHRGLIVTPELHQAALACCVGRTRYFRDYLVCLEATGARLNELLAAERKYWHPERRAFVYLSDRTRPAGDFRHKAAKYKDRFIYFCGDALTVIQGLMAEHTSGPLFRNRSGRPLAGTAVTAAFGSLRRRLGPAAAGYSAHAYRHTFATRWLEVNPNIDILSQLIGDDPATIRRFYSHLCDRWEGVHAALDAVRRSGESARATTPPGPVSASEQPAPTPPAQS